MKKKPPLEKSIVRWATLIERRGKFSYAVATNTKKDCWQFLMDEGITAIKPEWIFKVKITRL